MKQLSVDGPGKACRRCQQFKVWDDYHLNRSAGDGRQTYCKVCAGDMQRASKERHAEAVALRQAEKLLSARTTGKKTCTRCAETKPILSFYAHRGTRDGRATYCKECQKALSREWTAKNSEKVRERNAKRYAERPDEYRRNSKRWWFRAFGITEEIYQEMLARQGHACAICLLPERYVDPRTGYPRRLAVDHDHETGKVRGLLCGRCNRSIGQFADDHERLTRAAAYLRDAAIE